MRVLVVALALLACGCASSPPLAVGGDRAAGIVRYEVRAASFRTRVDEQTWAAALDDAVSRCRAWGYESASAFAVQCEQRVGGRCMDPVVTREYQCSSGGPG